MIITPPISPPPPAPDSAIRASIEDVWYLKEISFEGERVRVITQNFNGPCSFIAICNILILRKDIEILPRDRRTVSYEFLAQLVGEYLLLRCPDVDISAALTMMPLTTKGMDLNPLFTACTAFRPHGRGGALQLFEQAGIDLVHGWIVDTGTPAHAALKNTGAEDYDAAINLLVEVDHLTGGQFVTDENNPTPGGSHEQTGPLTQDDRIKVESAILIREFIETTSSQLTYHGLFTLASTIKPGNLVALFRNSHLSVLYKPPLPASESHDSQNETSADNGANANPSTLAGSSLFALATDQAFLREPTVVWERFDDVDGGASAFVDSDFRPSAPLGGDFAGATAEGLIQQQLANLDIADSADRELARQLQAEEDAIARQIYAERERRRRERAAVQSPPNPPNAPPKLKKKTSCLIM